MTWTIATGGAVLVLDTEVELARFHLLTFTAERVEPTDFDALRKRLVGASGHFQIEGDVPPDLTVAYDNRKGLLLRFESHGTSFEVGVQRRGDTLKMRLPDSQTRATVFSFTVIGPVYAQVSSV